MDQFSVLRFGEFSASKTNFILGRENQAFSLESGRDKVGRWGEGEREQHSNISCLYFKSAVCKYLDSQTDYMHRRRGKFQNRHTKFQDLNYCNDFSASL